MLMTTYLVTGLFYQGMLRQAGVVRSSLVARVRSLYHSTRKLYLSHNRWQRRLCLIVSLSVRISELGVG